MNPTIGITDTGTLVGWHLTRPDGTPTSGAITGPQSADRDAIVATIVMSARKRGIPTTELTPGSTREDLTEAVRNLRAHQLLVIHNAPTLTQSMTLTDHNTLISLLDRVDNPPVGVLAVTRDRYHHLFGRLRDQQHLDLPGPPFRTARHSLNGDPYTHLTLSSLLRRQHTP